MSRLLCLRVAGTQHFFECCCSFKNLLNPIFQQGPHAVLTCNFAHRLRWSLRESHFANLRIELHHFEDAEPAPVAGMVAVSRTLDRA